MNATSLATKGVICCPCPGLVPVGRGGAEVLRIEEEEIKRPLVMVKKVEIEDSKEKEDLRIIEVTGVKFENGDNNNDN